MVRETTRGNSYIKCLSLSKGEWFKQQVKWNKTDFHHFFSVLFRHFSSSCCSSPLGQMESEEHHFKKGPQGKQKGANDLLFTEVV